MGGELYDYPSKQVLAGVCLSSVFFNVKTFSISVFVIMPMILPFLEDYNGLMMFEELDYEREWDAGRDYRERILHNLSHSYLPRPPTILLDLHVYSTLHHISPPMA